MSSNEFLKKRCCSCKELWPLQDFYPDKNFADKLNPSCIDCSIDNARRLKKRAEFIQAHQDSVGQFFIADVYLVGYGRMQTYQHCCLSCKAPFFCVLDVLEKKDLFCDDCKVNEAKIKESNTSSVHYVGNVIGWLVKSQGSDQKRIHRNYKRVYERDRYTCQYCGYNIEYAQEFRALHIDHIKPWSAMGGNAMNNMVVSCERCNLTASDKWFDSFDAKRTYILDNKK